MKQLIVKFGMALVCCLVSTVSAQYRPIVCIQDSGCSAGQSCVKPRPCLAWYYDRTIRRRVCHKTCVAGLGASCSPGIPCGDQNTVCPLGQAPPLRVCLCKSGYVDSNGEGLLGGTCNAGAGLGSACNLNVPCCGVNAICDGNQGVCVCAPGYVEVGGLCNAGLLAVTALGSACNPNVPCGVNAICDGNTGVCVCAPGYVDSNGLLVPGGLCNAGLGSACNPNVPCSGVNAICSGTPGVCLCGPGYVDSNGPLVSGGLCNAGLGTPCSVDVPCSDCNAVCDCVTQKCLCGRGYSDSNGPLTGGGGCLAASCEAIYHDAVVFPPVSAEYTIYSSNGQPVVAFCDFYTDRGYTYIAKTSLATLQNFNDLYTPTSESSVNIKILYDNFEQHFVSMEQLSAYKHVYPLSLQLSTNVGYNTPLNMPTMEPSIYLGYLPNAFTTIISADTVNKPSIQGYRSGGVDWPFISCGPAGVDGNSYLVLLANPTAAAEFPVVTTPTPFMYRWLDEDQLLPFDRYMAPNFYYEFEMHMGPCGGGYLTTSNAPMVIGIALGFEFEINPDSCGGDQCKLDCNVAIPPP